MVNSCDANSATHNISKSSNNVHFFYPSGFEENRDYFARGYPFTNLNFDRGLNTSVGLKLFPN